MCTDTPKLRREQTAGSRSIILTLMDVDQTILPTNRPANVNEFDLHFQGLRLSKFHPEIGKNPIFTNMTPQNFIYCSSPPISSHYNKF